MNLEEFLDDMRADGWMVAVHNDYRLHGELYTFWLFTHAKTGRFVKGEATTDMRAVSDAWTMGKIILGLAGKVDPAQSRDVQQPPVYTLRPGAAALLVPLDLQPPVAAEIEMSPDRMCAWWNANGIDYGSQMPVKSGDRIATSQGEREVESVRAVDTQKYADVAEYTNTLDECHRGCPSFRWGWLIEVKEVPSDG